MCVVRASEKRGGVSVRAIEGEKFIEASDEWTWVRRAQRGDRKAFDRLIYSHDRHVLRLALCVFGNRERARKVYLQTFLKAARSIRRFRFNSSFRSWICRIAMEVSVAELKKEEDSRIPPC